MKTLVATKETQGKRKNDFCWADEGEFVGFSFECGGERIDGSCGCRRSFSGFHSFKATTTARVAEKGITEEQFVEVYRRSQIKAGWLKVDGDTTTTDKMAKELLRIASTFPAGAIVEKRGDAIQVRYLEIGATP